MPIGGTWRSLARLHMWQTGYPLHVMHGYVHAGARKRSSSRRLVRRVRPETLSRIEVVSDARRPLLAYGALVLEHIVRIAKPKRGRDVGARRARGPALFAARRRDARSRIRCWPRRASSIVLRSRSPRARRGADRLDRPLHGVVRPRRDRGGKAAASRRLPARPTSAGARIPIIAASSRSTSSRTPAFVGVDHPAAHISRWRCSSAMSGWSTTNCRRACANSPRPACWIAPACSAPRCGSPIWSRPRCPACCRARPMLVEQRQAGAQLTGEFAALAGERAVQPPQAARAPDRPRAGDGDVVAATGHSAGDQVHVARVSSCETRGCLSVDPGCRLRSGLKPSRKLTRATRSAGTSYE